jgi:N-acetylmuramoyl-L-alanine amidase
LVFVASLPQPLKADAPIKVILTEKNKKTVRSKVDLFSVGTLKMTAINQICSALKIPNTLSSSEIIISYAPGNEREYCKIKPQNHFATIHYSMDEAPFKTLQLGVSPAMIGGAMYLPPAQVARFLSTWLERPIKYNQTTQTFEADFSKPGVASSAFLNKSSSENLPTLPITPKPTYDTRYTIADYIIDEKANGAIMRLICNRPEVEYEFIRPNKNGVAYLTFRSATGDISKLTKSFSDGLLKKVTAIPLKSGGLQLTLNFNVRQYRIKSTEFKREPNGDDFLLHILSDVDVKAIYKTEKEKEIKTLLKHDREKWKFDVIALDAGHGGKDPGAIGYYGTYEKTIALSIVLQLGKLIEKNWPDVKVVYTRKTDKFIKLDERGKIANRHNAKLFVSVHCNASRNRKISGAEVYMLGLHKTEAALKVAERENAVILKEDDYKDRYKDYNEENLIMITMAQSAFTHQSQKIAELINNNLARQAKRNDRGVKQAGFMVLWTPSMPSILVETGYISNPKEEKFLKSKSGQKRVAKAIFTGLKKYRQQYEKERKLSRYGP